MEMVYAVFWSQFYHGKLFVVRHTNSIYSRKRKRQERFGVATTTAAAPKGGGGSTVSAAAAAVAAEAANDPEYAAKLAKRAERFASASTA